MSICAHRIIYTKSYLQATICFCILLVCLGCNYPRGEKKLVRVSDASFTELSDTDRVKLTSIIHQMDNSQIILSHTKKSIPPYVKTFLDTLESKSFKIADPEEGWNGSGGDLFGLPDKQLNSVVKSGNVLWISFLQGGDLFASQELYVFALSGETVKDFWFGGAPKIQTMEDVHQLTRALNIDAAASIMRLLH